MSNQNYDYYEIDTQRGTVTGRNHGDALAGFLIFIVVAVAAVLLWPKSCSLQKDVHDDYKKLIQLPDFNLHRDVIDMLYNGSIEASDGSEYYDSNNLIIFQREGGAESGIPGTLWYKDDSLGKDFYKVTGVIVGNVSETDPVSSSFRLTVFVNEESRKIYDSGVIRNTGIVQTFELNLDADVKDVSFILEGSRPFYITDIKFWNR